MKFVDLFGTDKFLVDANILVASFNKRIVEARKFAPSDVANLKEERQRVLENINQYTSDMFLEDYVNDTEAFILDLVISLKERGIDKMPLSALQRELAENGLEIDTEFLVDYLSTIDGVQEVNPGEDEIVFNTSIDRGVSDDEAAKEKEQMKKTATKVAKDNLEKDNEVPNLEI